MSFLRHGEICPCDEGAISRPRPHSSPWMSLQPGIPGGVLSSRARVRFPSRSHACKLQPRRTMLLQRTAQCDLTDCLSRGVQSTPICLTGKQSKYSMEKMDWLLRARIRPLHHRCPEPMRSLKQTGASRTLCGSDWHRFFGGKLTYCLKLNILVKSPMAEPNSSETSPSGTNEDVKRHWQNVVTG
jgi:hypothetical protein